MKRAFTLFTALLLLASCNNEDQDPLSINLEQIVLRSAQDSQATLWVNSENPWTVTVDGSGYTVDPTSGYGSTMVTVTATGSNNSRTRATLGKLIFREDTRTSEQVIQVVQSPAIAPQTVLVYMPGTSLKNYFQHNIDGIKAAVKTSIPGDGRILVCYQPDNQSKATLVEIFYDAKTSEVTTQTLKDYAPFNAGDPIYIRQLLTDAATMAPAQHYGMIIGCHGKAWIPSDAGGLKYRSAGKPGDLWTQVPGALDTRSFGDTGYELDIPKLAEALRGEDFKPEYLLFDDCFMASMEVLYDLRGVVGKVIASPCEIMAAGFPYDRMIPWLFTDEGSGYDLQKVCWEFWNLYMNEWRTLPPSSREQAGCISLAVIPEIDALADVMRRINAGSKKNYDLNALQTYEGLNVHAFYDLKHYVESMCADPALLSEFNTTFNRAFPESCRLYTPSFYSAYNGLLNPVSHYSGVSISDPSLHSQVTDYHSNTTWYKATH